MNTKLVKRKLTVQEFNNLRSQAGWPVLEDELVSIALTNSLFSVAVEFNHETIGMARVAGDGAIYFHILDVIVKPEFQRQGIGKQLMTAVMEYINTVGGKNTHVGLMSSKGRESFYKNFGFTERPNIQSGAGMILVKN